MEEEELNKQFMAMSETVFLESFNSMAAYQERMVDLYLSVLPWFPPEGRQVVKGLLETYRESHEYVKARIIRQYAMAAAFVPEGGAGGLDPASILQEIEEKVLGKVDFGFNPDILKILGDPEVGKKEIEGLKDKISPEILMRIMDMADSAFFGALRKGKVQTFYDAVLRLGMEHAKVLILFLSLLSLLRDKEAEMILVKGFARYALGGQVLAKALGLRDEETRRLELGCLLMDIGRIVIHLFKVRYGEDYRRLAIDDAFGAEHHASLGRAVCNHFHLSEDLTDMIFHGPFALEEKHVSLSGILKMIHCLVESIFRDNDGRLVLESPMPDARGRLNHSLGVEIQELFRAIGLSAYLEIIDTAAPPLAPVHEGA